MTGKGKPVTTRSDELGAGSLKVEYFNRRLNHTVQFTQQPTRLIYIASGAVLAFVYVLIEQVAPFAGRPTVVALLLLCVAGINVVHAALLLRQGQWYADLDTRYAEAVEASRVPNDKGFAMFLGSHSLYAAIHCVVALSIGLVAIWWFGNEI